MSQVQPSEAVGRALEALALGSFQPNDLRPLSDLSRTDRTAFEARWLDLPEATRVAAIRSMSELAAASFELDFRRAFESAIRRDPSATARQLALLGSAERDDTGFGELLVELMQSDSSVDVRAAAASLLGALCDRAVSRDDDLDEFSPHVRALLARTIADEREHPLVRGKALESIAAFGSPTDIAGRIEAFHESDDESLRTSSLIAMGRTCDRRWLGQILQDLRSEDVAVRRAAALACGRMGEVDAIVSLGSVARDRDREVRNAAIWSIGEIGGTVAAGVLARLLDQAGKDERKLIESAIDEANLGEMTGESWW